MNQDIAKIAQEAYSIGVNAIRLERQYQAAAIQYQATLESLEVLLIEEDARNTAIKVGDDRVLVCRWDGEHSYDFKIVSMFVKSED